jgi:hypothetical protein
MDWWLVTDVLGQPIGPIFNVHIGTSYLQGNQKVSDYNTEIYK